ncbi:MAG: Mur ligase family, catalytic domain, partial [Actinomycetota bacterium]
MAERMLSQVLADLRGGPACTLEGADAVVTDITVDSRVAGPGSIFSCVRGEHHDGHDFATDAV